MNDIRVHQATILTGSKKCFLIGDDLYLSPAQYDLMKHASQEELLHLLKNLPVMEIPQYDFIQPLPMTTPYPEVTPHSSFRKQFP